MIVLWTSCILQEISRKLVGSWIQSEKVDMYWKKWDDRQ